MKRRPNVVVKYGDVLSYPCDLLVLKHADGFFGVDELVSSRIGFSEAVSNGNHAVVDGQGTSAKTIGFLGVGPLFDFRYEDIRNFGRRVLEATEGVQHVRTVCLTTHGSGYGLDEREAFLSLVAGLYDAINEGAHGADLVEVTILEKRHDRAKRLLNFLSATLDGRRHHSAESQLEPLDARKSSSVFRHVGKDSERKPKLFVAMPFSEAFADEWEVSISDAAASAQVLCERIDMVSFTGDILAEIKGRIARYDGVIALVSGANPNVFLELGYAWGLGKPTVLLAKHGEALPFDIKGQHCVMYSGIGDLRTKLSAELIALKGSGVISGESFT